MSKYRNKIIALLSLLGILLSTAFFVNWYITNRLEKKIAEVILKNIKEATDGFYTISYEKLSVGLYSGELSIENLHFYPDSTTYHKWEQNDSLPKEVIDLKFNKIHFKGVNLKLIKNKRDLLFTLFDIDQPYLKITVPLASRKTKKSEPTQIDNPYEFIQNHLKSLRVEELNLKNAHVEYIVEDSIKPAIYSIKDTDFSIYNFHLDKDSYKNGKLLFSDNIVFNINKPQVLLSNNEFSLSIEGLKLNTQDSIIRIDGVKLISNKDSKNNKTRELNAELNQIAFDGIALFRTDESKILTVQKFLIDAPQIDMKYQMITKREEKKYQVNDSVVHSASLYEIISPILSKIEIDSIIVNKARFNYEFTKNGKKSKYSFNSLNFRAEQFLVDSNHISKYNFIHSEEFKIDASQLSASIGELNYIMNVGIFSLDSHTRSLSMENINIKPLTSIPNFISGNISSINSNNIVLDGDNIKADDLIIRNPDIYIKQGKDHTSKQKTKIHSKAPINLQLDLINITDGQIKFEQEDKHFSAYDVDIAIHQFTINHDYTIKDVIANIGNIKGNLKTPSGKFEISNIIFDTQQKKFSADNLKYQADSIKFSAEHFNINQFFFDLKSRNSASAKEIIFRAIDIKNTTLSFNTPSIAISNPVWSPSQISIEKISSELPKFSYLSKEIELKTELNNFEIEGILYVNNEIKIEKNILQKPTIYLDIKKNEHQKKENNHQHQSNIEKITLGEFILNKGTISVSNIPLSVKELKDIDISLYQFEFSPSTNQLDLESVTASIPNISIPMDSGMYALNIEQFALNTHKSELNLDIKRISLDSKYPKFEFAYQHPKNKDWFALKVGSLQLGGINIDSLLHKKVYGKGLYVNNTYLDNLKNQNIDIQHNQMPMIYEGIYKLPIIFKIDSTFVQNFNVNYEELAKGAEKPGKIFFTNMNGSVSNLTNIPDSTNQYLDLYADGYLMGTGHFDALWRIPASAQNDNFRLEADLSDFDLKELNQLISPMAPAAINSGYVSNLKFGADATSLGAHIEMKFLYNDLNISLWRQKGDQIKNKQLLSRLAGLLVKKSNPDKQKKAPRTPSLEVVRDPYHSTFNYFWQILQPAVVESVGVPEKRQNRFKRIGKIYMNIKNFFHSKKQEEELPN